MPPGGFLTMRHLDTLEARMTNHVKRGAGEDRSIGSGSRTTPGEARARHDKRETSEGEKSAGGSRGQVRQSAAAASFPLDYRFSVL